ncbi:MAG: fibronectin type III domain-containing protein [Saprospiraceae bacterium]|nr:fibronectin type III domain-containing protein [Saprospiraceae bacterium]
MKKFYNFLSFTWLVALAILLSTGGVQAQLAPQYPLTISTGTYSSISATGTSVASGDEVGTNITGLTGFTVNGVSYTNARMCSNGWLALYGTTAPTATTNYTALSTAMTNGAVIFAPFGRDLNTNANSGTAWWQQVGNELVFEWKNFNRYGYTDVLNFQIRLNTSTGDIKFVYGTMTPAAYSTYPQVGWKTNGTVATNWSTDINNVMIDVTGSPATCNWSNVVTGNLNTSTCYFNSANSGVVPASGLTYSWTKPNGTDPNPVRTFSAVSGITTNAATLTWTAPTGGASQYNVQYRAMGSCTWTNFSGNPVSSATATLTGLSPATTYQIRVQSGNGSVNGLWSHIPNQAGTGSGYVAAGTFTTACNAVTSFPWAESFDNASLPTCWTQQYVSGTLNWATVTTNGNSTITPHSGARMAEFRNTTTGSATRLVTPLLDLTSLTNPELTFYFANVNWLGDIDELRVYYSTDGGSNWTLIPGQTYTTEHATWQEVKVILPSPNSTYMVAFEGTSNYARGLDLDDVSIAEAPSCLATTATAATNITATTASANWSTATGSWIIEYGPTATFGTPGTGATAGNGNNTVVTASGVSTIGLTGLTASTGYSYVVRQDCSGSGNGYSANSNVITFTTAAACPATTATAASNITGTTASANWSTATGSWIIEYGPTATFGTPGTGATAGNVNNTVVTASNVSTIGLTGLTASTGYSYVVRQDCSGGGNGYSANSNVITFTTSQIPATLPYTQNFASNDFGFVNGSQTNKWAYGTATGNPANAIYVSNDGGTTNAYTVTSASVVHAYRDIAIPSGSTNATFNFDWKGFGESSYDYLRVWLVPTSFIPTAGTQITAGSGRIQVGGNLNQQSSWQTYSNSSLDVSTFAGQTMRLVFEWRNDASAGTNPPAAVDNIYFDIPTCLATTATVATNITATTASANWSTATGSWIIEYGPTATFGTPGTGATAGNVNNTVVTASNVSTIGLTGLTASTGYSYVVRQDCSGGGNGYSANSNVITFTTACLPASIPFSEGFESGYTDQTAVGGCWSQQSMAGAAVWTANNTLTTYNRAPRTGGWNAYLQYSNTDWLFYPVTLAGGTAYKFSVYARQDGATATNASITLAYGSSASDAGMTNTVVNAQGIVNGNYQEVAGVFTPSASGTYYIGIKGVINGSPWYISLDDISVTLAPTDAMDWCNLQFPATGNIDAGQDLTVYTRGYEPGVTDAGGQGAGITVWVGTSSTNSDPAGGGWTWTAATYNVDALNNDEYQAAIGSNLAPGTYYYASRWQLNGGPFKYGGYSSGGGGFWDGTTYVSGVLTVNSLANDDCSGAINLTVTKEVASQLTLGTMVGATASNENFSGSSCNSFSDIFDVWYKVTVPASGNVNIETFVTGGTSSSENDYSMQVYTGTCGNLTYLNCNEDANLYGTPTNFMPAIVLTGQTPNSVLYIRIRKASTSRSTFAIAAYDPSDLNPLASSNCSPGTVNISTAVGNGYRWVPLFDNAGNLIAEIFPKGQNLGNVSASVNINTGNVRQDGAGVYYLDRDFTVTVANQPSLACDIYFYFTDAELTALKTADPSVTGAADLSASKFANRCGKAPGTIGTLLANFDDLTRTADNAHSVAFSPTSFSTFYLHKGNAPLPVNLVSFKAQQVKRGEVLLDWRVKDEVNMKQYDVQRSVDGKNFTTIGTVGNLGKEVYTLIDPKPAQGINYYRLSMVEANGLTNYSHIVAININDGKALHASPNPVTGDLTVEVKGEVGKQAVIDIIDYTGNKVRTVAIPAGKVTVDMTSLPTGVYVVQYIDGTTVYTTRVVKM